MKIHTWNEYLNIWKLKDSVKIDLLDEDGGLYGTNSIPHTSFNQVLEVKTDFNISRLRNYSSVLVSVTAEVEAMAPPNLSSLYFGPRDFNSASAMLDMILCAVDVGLAPITISLERRKIPRVPHRL